MGASKVYAIDAVPARLAMARECGSSVITVDFKAQDVSKRIQGEVPDGLDGKSNLCLAVDLAKWPSLHRRHHFPRAQDSPSQGREGAHA